MNKSLAIKQYNDFIKENMMYNYAATLISYDSDTDACAKSYEEHQDVSNYFSLLVFKRKTSKEYVDLINNLEKYYLQLSPKYQRIVDISKKELENNQKVPFELMERYQKSCSDAFYYWKKAKNENNYSIFRPYLEKVIKCQIEMGNYIKKDNQSIYEAFLDSYEEGITEKELDEFFAKLKSRIVPLLKKTVDSNVKIDDEFMSRKVRKSSQMKMGIMIAKEIGYDFSRGQVKETEHPFTTDISDNDIRITTHIYPNNFASNLFTMAHEGGHGIYGQQISPKYNNSILKDGASMAFHESQSRFFENIIARNKYFVDYYYPKLAKLSPNTFKDVSSDKFYKAINKVCPSLIRTEADELTYCLHIMIRYEIEKLMINGKVDYDNLNKLWNQKYKEYLGIDVPNDTNGILQDVHWTGGVGYFFSYALGNAYSAQIYNTLRKQLDVDNLLSTGKVKVITKWLKDNVHQYGRLIKSKDLIFKITGENLNVDYYCNYLEEKFSKIYNLK